MYTVTGLSYGRYDFQIRAVNQVGESPHKSLTTNQVSTPPGAPVLNTVTPSTNESGRGTLLIQWTVANNHGSPITLYSYRYKQKGQDYSDWYTASSGDTVTEYTISGLRVDTYVVQMKAANTHGDGPESNEVEATIEPVVPGAVTDLAGSAGRRGELNLTWTPPTSNGGSAITHYEYRIRKTNEPSFPPTWTPVSGGITSSFTIVNLSYSKYIAQVRAVNSVGAGQHDTSEETPYVQTEPGVSVIQSIEPQSGSGSWGAKLIWQPTDSHGSNITAYAYQMKSGNGAYGSWVNVPIANVSTESDNSLSYTVSNLSTGTYSFKIHAINAHGTGPDSSEKSTTLAEEPVLTEATVSLDWLELTYNYQLDSSSVPPTTAFTVSVDGVDRTVDNVYVGGQKVVLRLSSAVAPGEGVTLTYTVPTGVGANPLRESTGTHNVGALSSESVENQSLQLSWKQDHVTLPESWNGLRGTLSHTQRRGVRRT